MRNAPRAGTQTFSLEDVMHHRPTHPRLTGLTAALLLAGLAACTKTADHTADSAATVARADSAATVRSDSAAGTVARTDSAASAATGGWTEPSILGFASAANESEIAEGRLAEKKATNPAVKAFARQMVADHEAMLKDGQALAAKLNATADTTTGAAHDLLDDAHKELKDLTDKAAGADWDEDFIEHEIDGHQKVLDKLQDAAKNATNADLRAGLEKATGKVQQHLTKAQDIKSKTLKK
jgi:putative membrane protein